MKYQKIYDSIDKYRIEANLLNQLTKKEKWVVTEKIHGANFSVHYDDGNIKFAKRSGFIGDEAFFNYELIKKDLEQSIRILQGLQGLQDSKYIIVYGELCGGYYPENPAEWKGAVGERIDENHKLIVMSSEKAVQEGIYYSNKLTFLAYDIAYKPAGFDHLVFLDYAECQDKLQRSGFTTQSALAICSYDEAVNFDIKFNSKLPEQLGMDPLPANTNISEGIVIKPLALSCLKALKARPLIKIKNYEFMEIDLNASRAEIKSAINYKVIMASMINVHRCQSAISKIGEYNDDTKDLIAQEIYEDVMNELYTTHPSINLPNKVTAMAFLRTLINNQLKTI